MLFNSLRRKEEELEFYKNLSEMTMASNNAEVRAYEDLKDRLEDITDMVRRQKPYWQILDFIQGRG